MPDAARDAGEDRRVAQSVGARLARPQLVDEVKEVARVVALERDHELLVVEPERVRRVDADLRVAAPDRDVLAHDRACAPREAAGTTRASSRTDRRTGTCACRRGPRAGPPRSTRTPSSSRGRSRACRPIPSGRSGRARRGTRGCPRGRARRSTASGRRRRACRPASMRAGSGPRRSCRRRPRTRACGSRARRRQAPPGRVHLQERELDDIAVHGPLINIRSPDRGLGARVAHGRSGAGAGAPAGRDRLLARPAAACQAARARAPRAGAGARRLRLHVVDPGLLHA